MEARMSRDSKMLKEVMVSLFVKALSIVKILRGESGTCGSNGGPDSAGYRWVVANHSFEDISNTNRITVTDDGMSSSINIGFDFVYYRRLYSRVFASRTGLSRF